MPYVIWVLEGCGAVLCNRTAPAVRRCVDILGPGIGALKLQSLRESPHDARLQGVVVCLPLPTDFTERGPVRIYPLSDYGIVLRSSRQEGRCRAGRDWRVGVRVAGIDRAGTNFRNKRIGVYDGLDVIRSG